MAVLYYADFSSMNEEKLIKEYLGKVDKERLAKIMRTKAVKAKVRSLLAGYLLQRAIKDYLSGASGNAQSDSKQETWQDETVIDLKYRYGEHGKPYLKDYPGLYFSLSHSGDVVVCVLAEQEIGLDVQQHVKIKEGLARRFFTEEENALLAEAAGVQAYEQLFFRMWSIKESYIKYTGLGMKQGLDTFSIEWGNKLIRDRKNKVAFEEIKLDELPEYAVSVSMKEREEIRIVRQ